MEVNHPAGAPESGGGKKPVILYIMILFIAAFLLMALSFAMHQRSNRAEMNALKDSVNALQNAEATESRIAELEAENQELRKQAALLDSSLQNALEQLDVLPDTISHLEYTLEQQEERTRKTLWAMDCFWQLAAAYEKGRYDECRSLIDQMEAPVMNDSSPMQFLPAESLTENGAPSPLERYREIKTGVRWNPVERLPEYFSDARSYQFYDGAWYEAAFG